MMKDDTIQNLLYDRTELENEPSMVYYRDGIFLPIGDGGLFSLTHAIYDVGIRDSDGVMDSKLPRSSRAIGI
jgi:hypothetical protein